MIRNKQILVAVLNWGLGHATRSIPVIHQLIADGNQIILASDGAALSLLRSAFPSLQYLALPGYEVTYPSKSMVWNMALQMPKLKKAIRAENLEVDRWINHHNIDVIISDNRYGCHNPSTLNIFISHQLNLQVPFSSVINRLHAKMLNRFDEIWVVDNDDRALSGSLADPKWLPKEKVVKHIGPQSRLQKVDLPKRYDIAAILSGPEPQRSILEEELYQKLFETDLKSILVQGSRNAPTLSAKGNLEVLAFADQTNLSEIICSSEMVISRSGYSTIMDLSKLGGGALFIPTPGQSEQIYLAERLCGQKIVQYQKQGMIDISKAWERRTQFAGF